jgi:hypothetical protein
MLWWLEWGEISLIFSAGTGINSPLNLQHIILHSKLPEGLFSNLFMEQVRHDFNFLLDGVRRKKGNSNLLTQIYFS